MVSDGGADKRGREAADLAVGAEHDELGRALVENGERMSEIVRRRDHPASKIDDRVGHRLIGIDLVDVLFSIAAFDISPVGSPVCFLVGAGDFFRRRARSLG